MSIVVADAGRECVQMSDDNDHQSSSRRLNSRAAGAEDEGAGKLRLAHYKGSLVIVKPLPGDITPTVTQLDKIEMTTVRCRLTFQQSKLCERGKVARRCERPFFVCSSLHLA